MKRKPRGDLNGFLDAGSHIDGELRFDDTFRVDGRLTGRAVSNGDLVVGENGLVEADVWKEYDALQPEPLYEDFLCIRSGGLAMAFLHHPLMDPPPAPPAEVKPLERAAPTFGSY